MRRRRERGVALLLVMVVLLLVATLSTEIALTTRTHMELAKHSMNDFLLRSVVEGRREILAKSLEFDLSLKDNIDTEGDIWAWKNHQDLSSWGETLPDSEEGGTLGNEEGKALKYRNRDVHIEAWVEDERSKVNLRHLLRPADDPFHVYTKATLIRLIDIYRDKWNKLDVDESEAEQMVDELIEWLTEKSDTEDNPAPAAKKGFGRLLTVDDLLRVPGGKWTEERLFDCRDPDESDDAEFTRTVNVEETDDTPDVEEDATWSRQNGCPGLSRFLSVWAERGDDPEIRINLNTAPTVVVRALLDAGEEELADALVERRRQGGDTAAATTTESGPPSDETGGWFKSLEDVKKVEGMGTDLAKDHPRLEKLAAFKSSVYSMRIIATVLSTTMDEEGNEGETTGTREIQAALQYREVVQRTSNGLLSLYAERRRDPMLGKATE